MTLSAFLDDAVPRLVLSCFQAGDAIMRHYKTGVTPDIKADGSPTTLADKEAEAILFQALEALPVLYPIVGEEDSEGKEAPTESFETFWLVDPLDGTREFLTHTDDFTVNVGLVHQGHPVFGMIYVPVTKMLFFARAGREACQMGRDGMSEILRPLSHPLDQLRMVTSRQTRTSPQVFLDMIAPVATVKDALHAGSSLKFCHLAEGRADFYPRPGRTMIWDTCAGDAIVRAVGGMVIDQTGRPLTYQSSQLENPPFAALSKDLWGAYQAKSA